MEEKYPLSFLKTISRSSDDAFLTAAFEKRIAQLTASFAILDRASSFFYLFDFVCMRYLYCSESIQHVMGYTARDWIERGPDWVFSTVYPEDVRRLKDLHKALFDYYYSLPVSERKDYKYVWQVRVVRKDGQPIWIMQQGSFIDIESNGKPMITFDILTDTTQFKKDNCITLTMFKNVNDPKLKLYFPLAGGEPFTKREIELIGFLSEGLSSKEIAERLFISPHTVDTHRRNMLKKSGVRDSNKMIVFARNNGWI
jgi:DNA-binding CsgD family transcriptional regulator